MEGTFNSSLLKRVRAGRALSPEFVSLLRECERAERGIGLPPAKVEIRGKFIYVAGKKFYLKSVSMDAAAPAQNLSASASELGANVVYLADPSKEALGTVRRLGLKVVVLLEFAELLQSLFAGSREAEREWQNRTRRLVDGLKTHSNVIAYDLNADFSDSILRFLGRPAIQRLIGRACDFVKKLDANRPVTCTLQNRYLDLRLPFLDFLSYKLETTTLSDFRIGVARLQNRAGDKPLVLHSSTKAQASQSLEEQAHCLGEQIRMSFYAGCAGFCLHNWSESADTLKLAGTSRADESFAGTSRADSSFADKSSAGKSLADRKLAAEPAAIDSFGTGTPVSGAIRAAFADCPFPAFLAYPKISVVICAYNGEEWIEECLDGVSRLDYPDYEVILVNDGSTDHTLGLAEPKAKQYGFKIVNQLPNAGLSAARNLGMRLATGEIVAYLDQDAFPDVHWLRYLAITFLSTQSAVVGGPNINPLSGSSMSDCIDSSPGNSQIVMLDEEMADHVPGCNLAVRRLFMQSIGGFDLQYRYGGDDVNFCWKVIRAGGRLAVSPGAMIWHYRRKSIDAYLRQQRSYGRGEAALEKDWPQRFNSLGHQVLKIKPANSEMSTTMLQMSSSAIYQAMSGGRSCLELLLRFGPTMPEWSIVLSTLALLSLLGVFLKPFLLFLPVFAAGLFMWVGTALQAGLRANLRYPGLKSRLLVAYLHLAQPLVRLQGRLQSGMSPWRSRCRSGFVPPRARIVRIKIDSSVPDNGVVQLVERAMERLQLPAVPGESESNWDWQVEGGICGGVRLLANADTGALILRVLPYAGPVSWFIILLAAFCAALALAANAPFLGLVFAALGISSLRLSYRQAGEAAAAVRPLFDESAYCERSLWDRFAPPRHFFSEPLHRFVSEPSVACELVSNGGGEEPPPPPGDFSNPAFILPPDPAALILRSGYEV